MEPAKKTPPLFIVSHWAQTCHRSSVNGLLPTFPLSLSLITFFYRSYTTFVIDYFVTVNCWSFFSHLPQSLSLIIVILQIIQTFWHCLMLAHKSLLLDSHPAFFLPIATTSNKNFWKCRNCKWEIQMFVNSGTRGNKTGLLCSLSAVLSFIKPGTRQTGLTGRFQKSFGINSWNSSRKGKKKL